MTKTEFIEMLKEKQSEIALALFYAKEKGYQGTAYYDAKQTELDTVATIINYAKYISSLE